ncbi:hypothetical protein PV08_00119 [Exophiala spinifera]|uniref:Heterokaryon incompatibility domain-containing protein n=1 Tax=Exophiala spinifera TaxID=91928 RepID=A0A0D2A3X8_9EURO|nr:uncharacterized protein PV08_00119 [Exophiala spinifera]KIW19547.1 hypothetical protein PV08_00119 [Exophiala spinifera]
MERGVQDFWSLPWLRSRRKAAPESYLETKSHGLHNLSLCRACDNLDPRCLPHQPAYIHLKNCFHLNKRSQKCRLCAFISQSLGAVGSRDVRQILVSYDISPKVGVPLSLSLRCKFLEVNLGDRDAVVSLELYAENGVPVNGMSNPAMLRSPKSDLSTFLRGGMPSCFRDSYNNPSVVPALAAKSLSNIEALIPLRLLDVGNDDYSSQIRLHIRRPDEKGKYATLSYRWGNRMPLKTLRRTLKRYLQSLEIQSLPQTFQDAITVTRLLGIRYLWIDALCIIQDDPKDWLEQAGQMCSIYQYSSLTIAIHSAKSPLDGFLWRGTVPNSLRVSPRGTRPTFWLQIPPLSDNAIRRAFGDSQITGRGWITQELCLSQLVLHFVEDRVIWECCHEDCATAHPSEDHMERFRKRSVRPSQDWLPFVSAYSTCRTTKESDKLAAIAGIAQAWPRNSAYFRHNGYYCGVFDDDVHSSLLWFRAHSLLIRRAGRAPHWSWASVDGGILFIRDTIQSGRLLPLMEVDSIDCICRRDLNGHFLCTRSYIRLNAAIGDGFKVGFIEKSKRFYSAPLDGPRYVTTLGYLAERVVGWAIFDCDIDDHPKFRYVQVAAKVADGNRKGSFVVIVKPCPKSIGLYLRVGMGYLFKAEVLKTFQREDITLC